MAVDDGVDLVGSAGGLVDPLAVDRDRTLRRRKQVIEFFDLRRRQSGAGQDILQGDRACRFKSGVRSLLCVCRYRPDRGSLFPPTVSGDPQTAKYHRQGRSADVDPQCRRSGSGADRSRQCACPAAPSGQPRSSGKGPDDTRRDWIRPEPADRLFQVLVTTRYRVAAEGAAMARYARGHAQS